MKTALWLSGKDFERDAVLASSTRLASAISKTLGLPSIRGALLAFNAGANIETYLMIIAAWRAGATIIPLNPRADARERDRSLAAVSGAVFVNLPEVINADSSSDEPLEERDMDAESAFAILFTSGTTGAAKGVVLSRRAFLASAENSAQFFGWEPDDRWMLCSPLGNVGAIGGVIRCWLAERTLVLYGDRAFDPRALHECLLSARATLISLLPFMLKQLLDAVVEPPPRLRVALLVGAPPPLSLLKSGVEAGWPVYTSYGLTETCAQVALQRVDIESEASLGAVGKLVSGVSARIVDDQILIASQTLLSGYVKQAESPLTTDGYFPTGDLGTITDDGLLTVFSRQTERITVQGNTIYPRTIEAVVERDARVRGVLAFGAETEAGTPCVAVCVCLAPNTNVLEVLASADELLAEHERPRLYVVLDELPLTPAGKPDRRRIQSLPLDRR